MSIFNKTDHEPKLITLNGSFVTLVIRTTEKTELKHLVLSSDNKITWEYIAMGGRSPRYQSVQYTELTDEHKKFVRQTLGIEA